MLISTEFDASLEGLQVFVDPLRAEIVRMLATEQLCTCHLVEATGAAQSTVSYHLKVLRDAGLVTAEPAGRVTYYRLHPEGLEATGELFEQLAASARTASQLRRPCP